MTTSSSAGWQVLRRTGAAGLRSWRGRFRRNPAIDAPPPLRAELFSADQMERHGATLARTHVLRPSAKRDRLLQRLAENEQVLLSTRTALTAAVKDGLRIAPAGEWLLDNHHLIDEQIHTARQHLPGAYSRELPCLARGDAVGLPRVHELALEVIAHGDGRVDAETLARFVAAYQTLAPLTLGELWAIPIMLRLALIENLRRVGARIIAARIHFDAAEDWANRMMEIAASDPKSLILVIADMARSNPPMASAFVAELARRLQGHGPALALPLTWIEQRLAESSRTIEHMVLLDAQQQAADQVSISNSIGSLRFLGGTDWRVFVESLSGVEQVLREDPAGVYHAMEFATRDRYRHVVAALARRSRMDEATVARAAITLAARCAAEDGPADHRAHVGFYLIDAGLARLEAALEIRQLPITRLRRAVARSPLALYLGGIVLGSMAVAAALLDLLPVRALPAWSLLPLGLLALLGASQLASALANRITTLLRAPHLLPRMDYALGLPPQVCTLVVVPTLLLDEANIEELLEALEVRFLGNRDPQLHFGLLTDLRDAPRETLAEDAPLLECARAGIERLNAKYPGEEGEHFLLFHRPRRWNPGEGCWMGYERKRGKLADLNAALRGTALDRFAMIVGRLDPRRPVRYVITLDTDTQLPRDAARQFIATMAHPLNHPRYDLRRQRVCGGYGILQPRMAESLSGARRSHYARLCGGEPGIDPYTRAVSDVYQDLCAEGSFIGKGIYDVDAFERSLAGRFPENRILSHDLLEGCYARSGLLSDVHLLEQPPASYAADVCRRERWIRGDWQIAAWLFPRVPGPDGQSLPNPLSVLSRWKILDNLRRSLVPAALTVLLPVGWCIATRPWAWTLAVLAIGLLPPLLAAVLALLRRPAGAGFGQHLDAVGRSAARDLAAAALGLACLPYEAWFSLAAVLRALRRMLLTHRGLLEWGIAGEQERRNGIDVGAAYRRMWIAPVAAVAIAVLLGGLRPEALAAATAILGLWFAAPGIAWWISRPLVPKEVELSVEQTQFLRLLARRTWAYFERFVVAGDNWLPPDNVQEDPGPVVAHRTSPTNIGLSLLANLTACDFGFIGSATLLERTRNTLGTLGTLERHRGHFYNWYDTLSLQPLSPRYVSAVDSGNLAGHLLTLRAGLLALPEQPIVGARLFEGLADTLGVLAEVPAASQLPAFSAAVSLVKDACAARATALTAIESQLEGLVAAAARLYDASAALQGEAPAWAEAFARQCAEALAELRTLAPWLERPAAAQAQGGLPEIDATTSLQQLAGYTQLEPATGRARARIAESAQLAQLAGEFAEMEYGFLYDSTRHLLAIGYNVEESRRDTGFYDLLASEARLGCFVAIAQGELPQQSWFALGRLLTTAGGDTVLASWSGSMFEYLMPLLVMPSYPGSLLEQTCRGAVARQIAWGRQRALPWGVSESGYNSVDAALNYQYHAFGVPGLGLKRGLAEDAVVAPYASALALMVAPEAACTNLQRLAAGGLAGSCGLFEAVDYTPVRLGPGQSAAIVRSFMAHHQGMTLLALGHRLLDRPMQRRFVSDPRFQATLLLLQERIPRISGARTRLAAQADGVLLADAPVSSVQALIGADTPTPEVQLLSNGRYQVMVSNAGGGYSRWKDLALTRWREDSTCDNWGTFLYLRDVALGEVWSAALQPTRVRPSSYEATFSEGRAEFRRRDHDYETYTEIVVSPEDDIELRRVRITNHASVARTIEVTSYAEVVLAPALADALQPGFGNLFVQTEIIHASRAILCTRRPRSGDEQASWMLHLLAAHGGDCSEVSFETDRMRFIGRTRTLVAPRALAEPDALSGSAGSVLDPIVAIRARWRLEPGECVSFDLVSGAAADRAACLALVEKYRDRHLADRVFDLARTHGGVTLRQINASAADAELYRRLAGPVLYANAALRAESGVLLQNRRGQSSLWGYAISGDLPIVLLRIADPDHVELARQLIQCHAYWRLKGLVVDLVIWNEEHIGYRQHLQDQIMGLIATGTEAQSVDRPGGIFVRFAEQIAHEDRILLQAVARVIISDSRGSLLEQLDRRVPVEKRPPRLVPTRNHRAEPPAGPEAPAQGLQLANPHGGFSADGCEYLISVTQTLPTPAPWSNVLANPHFGTVVTESGLGYTWSENAHEYRLTPWSDDPVGASGGEAIWLRDEESAHYWSATPLPTAGAMPYRIRHGFGYSVFEHTSGGIHSELWVYVDLEEAVKFSVLKVRNGSGRARRLSATGYVDWVLGDLRAKSAMHVVTTLDPASGALFARNSYHGDHAARVAFFDVDDLGRTLTGDRSEFLGRNGTLARPEAMGRTRLSGRLGVALDPCGAIQVPFELADGEQHEIIFRLGAARDLHGASALAQRLRKPGTARASLERVQQFWTGTLGAVRIDTPDPALNLLGNGWLLYQTLACRLWARSGFYQSGGAFGFRDQLQDVMALVHAAPALVREHLLRSAARQYAEGDVQHWWHPPAGRGVRTRCSDDYLWLPLATCRYVRSSGDSAVLEERVPFLAGRALGADEESYYDLPGRAEESATLYQHCVRAIEHGLRFGEHGLPLMGSGDWNDGMNRVGIHGRGESVWLGFFLHEVLRGFAGLAREHADHDFAERCLDEAARLQRNLAEHAWDGEWYRRAWFDDGTPLGSSTNVECRIDSIAQSWSVLSGAADPGRARRAMESLDQRLVRREQGLVQLLDPPFDTSSLDPGYIKGYVPGVRENGGQYTHAAIWAAMAFAALGDSRRAWELAQLINPVNHTRTAAGVAVYKSEPYVLAADVYAIAPHTGRGGWSWYTGSAGWMYRLLVESLLGLERVGARLCFRPCLPQDWESCAIDYRFGSTHYRIAVSQLCDAAAEPALRCTLDGVEQDGPEVVLLDDQREHAVGVHIVRA